MGGGRLEKAREEEEEEVSTGEEAGAVKDDVGGGGKPRRRLTRKRALLVSRLSIVSLLVSSRGFRHPADANLLVFFLSSLDTVRYPLATFLLPEVGEKPLAFLSVEGELASLLILPAVSRSSALELDEPPR